MSELYSVGKHTQHSVNRIAAAADRAPSVALDFTNLNQYIAQGTQHLQQQALQQANNIMYQATLPQASAGAQQQTQQMHYILLDNIMHGLTQYDTAKVYRSLELLHAAGLNRAINAEIAQQIDVLAKNPAQHARMNMIFSQAKMSNVIMSFVNKQNFDIERSIRQIKENVSSKEDVDFLRNLSKFLPQQPWLKMPPLVRRRFNRLADLLDTFSMSTFGIDEFTLDEAMLAPLHEDDYQHQPDEDIMSFDAMLTPYQKKYLKKIREVSGDVYYTEQYYDDPPPMVRPAWYHNNVLPKKTESETSSPQTWWHKVKNGTNRFLQASLQRRMSTSL